MSETNEILAKAAETVHEAKNSHAEAVRSAPPAVRGCRVTMCPGPVSATDECPMGYGHTCKRVYH